MRVLVTNGTLAGRTGTEILTLNLVRTLKKLGHQPSVYTPKLGPIADEIRQLGIPVTDDINLVADTPDIIHGHHTIETATAALRFPTTPAIFVCHDFTAWHDAPPRLPNVVAHYAISDGFLGRLTRQEGIAPDSCSVILNGIDTERFVATTSLADKPRRALIFAKNIQHVAAIQQACDQMGIAHDAVGAAVGNISHSPETLIQNYDLVFTSALSALECMAAGRAVICCDGRGLAGFVSPNRYDAWHRENFGLPVFNQSLSVANIAAEIARYDADHAREVTSRVRRDASLEAWGLQYVDAYQAALDTFVPPTPAQTAAATASFVQTWSPARTAPAWLAERSQLVHQIERLADGLAPAPLGQTILANNAQVLALSGFHPPEDWGGTWSARARFAIRLAPQSAFSKLTLYGLAYTPADRDTYTMHVSINGQRVGTVIADATSRPLILEFDAMNDPVIWIEIEGDTPLIPSSYGTLDDRPLGFALTGLALDT